MHGAKYQRLFAGHVAISWFRTVSTILMAKFDVYESPDKLGYLLDVHAELLDELNTRVVVPLLARYPAPKPANRLNSVFNLKGEQYVMVTQFIATVPRSILRDPISNLREEFAEITSAIDMLIQGYSWLLK